MSAAGRKKIAFVLGTRPEIIKCSPLIRLLERQRHPYFLIHTGQHYSYEMDKLFFRELGLPLPRHHLGAASHGRHFHGEHTGRMLTGIEKILLREKPDVVLVQGDTNSVLAGSLAASKMRGVRLGHVEAGLRSYDRAMPEEINRVIADHVSDYLFPPTEDGRGILLKEGIPSDKIFVTGNTIVDAVNQNLEIAKKRRKPQGYIPRVFFLMTLHRQENVDDQNRLESILEGVGNAAKEFCVEVLFPAHPRTVNRLKEFGLRLPKGLRLMKPIGFLDFLSLEASARMVITDSGGVQEEACILKVPCVTLRTSTERPETVRAGANVVAGYLPVGILRAARKMLHQKRVWKNPFGDGKSAEKIIRILKEGRS